VLKKVLMKKEAWQSGWPTLILIWNGTTKSLRKSCPSAPTISLSSLLGWKGILIAFNTFPRFKNWLNLSIENRQEWAAYFPFLPSYRPEVWNRKTMGWWRKKTRSEDNKPATDASWVCPKHLVPQN
jgi:hypothetical protein